MTNIKSLIEKYSKEVLVATQNDKVYKDECVYSYDTSESENGVFVCLRTFICVSKEMLPVHFSKTQSHLYLNIKTWRKEVCRILLSFLMNTS
jgi:ubiquitin carboxyl-terminal hydrolase 5/13